MIRSIPQWVQLPLYLSEIAAFSVQHRHFGIGRLWEDLNKSLGPVKM